MKLNDAYLCGNMDCDTVFSLKEQILSFPLISQHHPVCPICGSTYTLNLGRVLNRKEVKDETSSNSRVAVSASGSDRELFKPGAAYPLCPGSEESKFFTGSGNQKRTTESGGENLNSHKFGVETNRTKRAVLTLVDVVGVLFSHASLVFKAVSRFDANSKKLPAITQGRGCEHIDRSEDISGEAAYNEWRLSEGADIVQRVGPKSSGGQETG